MIDYENEKKHIHDKVSNFANNNREVLKKAKKFKDESNKNIHFVNESHLKLDMYLADVKIMIITANEIERDTLFAYFSKNSKHHIVKIARKNLVYSFLKIGNNNVVHIEPATYGSYTKGGAHQTIMEAVKIVHPSIVISLGVAFGANYEKNEIGDVLVGQQHFSYDKATKVSNGTLNIKRLHIVETDEYMISRFKSNVPTEDKMEGFLGNEFNVVFGNMVTGEFVVDSIEVRHSIFSPFQLFGIIGGEMEAYGIFEAVNGHKNTHCILMKGICDWGAGKNETFDGEPTIVTDVDMSNKIIVRTDYNPKNEFQALAMLDACEVCEKLLIKKEMFSDSKNKGIKKRFWRSSLGKVIKSRIMQDKY